MNIEYHLYLQSSAPQLAMEQFVWNNEISTWTFISFLQEGPTSSAIVGQEGGGTNTTAAVLIPLFFIAVIIGLLGVVWHFRQKRIRQEREAALADIVTYHTGPTLSDMMLRDKVCDFI